MAGLGALAELYLHHLDLFERRSLGEPLSAKTAVRPAAAEIARTDLPDQVAAHFAVISADAAFSGIVGESALLCAAIQRADRVRAQRPEAHGRNVEDRCGIGLCAIGAADCHAKWVGRERPRREGVAQPLKALRIDVVLGAEGPLVDDTLGALIDDSPFVAAERQSMLFILEEVLTHLRPDLFKQITQMRRDRVVAQDCVPGLEEVDRAQQCETGERRDENGQIRKQTRFAPRQGYQQHGCR